MQLIENQYQIQGLSVSDLCAAYGTPLYVYDTEVMLAKLKELKTAFKGVDLKLKYAAKALTNISVLKFFRQQGIGLDVVSIEEARLGLLAGFAADEILFTPNCVSLQEIEEAVELGVRINIDNISILEQFGHKFGNTVPCCIRLNPHIMAGGNHKIQVGHIDSKFGISILQLRHVLRVVKANNMKINGLHMHTGSDILDADVFLRGAQILFEAAEDFQDLEFMDFGSGFKVAYKEGDITTNLADLGAKLRQAFQDFCKKYGRDLELWFEPGKFLVSESGTFFVQTNVIKQTPASLFVGVNSGMNHLIRPMFYDSYHQIVNVSNPTGASRVYAIVGYICETDTFGWDRKLTEVREGDILAIRNAGAYGFMMASNYNSRLRPAEVLIHQGKAYLIRERETLEDLLKNQILVELPSEAAIFE